jgi:hypothetical protein
MNALGLIYQEDKEKIENSWQETFARDIQQDCSCTSFGDYPSGILH